jgi:protein tyrosine/serine phosphatase
MSRCPQVFRSEIMRGSLLVVALMLALASGSTTTHAQAAAAARAPQSTHAQESTQSTQTPKAYAELPNFHQVNARLYRGGQPRRGGLGRLAALGVKTVVNLRDDDDRAQDEEREARSLGLRYFNVPISRAGRPGRERIKELMVLIDAPENQPVFVHCKRGADRTGAVIAVYRITHDGWTGEQALDEAEAYGIGFWQHGKKDFIKDYYRDHAAPAKKAESQSKESH